MMKFSEINLFLTFKWFMISVVLIIISTFSMFSSAKSRYEKITYDVIANADRTDCPITLYPNKDKGQLEYIATCPWGEVKGELSSFDYLVSPVEHLSCYSIKYSGDVFEGCSRVLEEKKEL